MHSLRPISAFKSDKLMFAVVYVHMQQHMSINLR